MAKAEIGHGCTTHSERDVSKLGGFWSSLRPYDRDAAASIEIEIEKYLATWNVFILV